MEPPNGEFGSQEFNDFVDSLMNPMLCKHPLPVMNNVMGDTPEVGDEHTVVVYR